MKIGQFHFKIMYGLIYINWNYL